MPSPGGGLQQLLRQCGLTTLDRRAEHYGLGLTIGNAEVRLLELANAYACLARLGEYKPCRMVLDAAGQWEQSGAHSRPSTSRQVASLAAAYVIADILSDSDARALAFGVESPLRFKFPAACKTGTSSDFRDNWAFGYTPEVGCWMLDVGCWMLDVGFYCRHLGWEFRWISYGTCVRCHRSGAAAP